MTMAATRPWPSRWRPWRVRSRAFWGSSRPATTPAGSPSHTGARQRPSPHGRPTSTMLQRNNPAARAASLAAAVGHGCCGRSRGHGAAAAPGWLLARHAPLRRRVLHPVVRALLGRVLAERGGLAQVLLLELGGDSLGLGALLPPGA